MGGGALGLLLRLRGRWEGRGILGRRGLLADECFSVCGFGGGLGRDGYTAPGFCGGDEGSFGLGFCFGVRHARVAELEVDECKGGEISLCCSERLLVC